VAMAKQTRSQIGWRWFLVLFGGLSWLSIGCTPGSMSMLLMPFTDNKTDPTEYKLFPTDKEVTLVVMANFKESQFQEELRKADTELVDQVSQFLRKRCEENKHKLKLIPQAQVRSFQLKQLAEGDLDPVEIGRKFKADYVLQLEIESFSIYEPKSYPKMFRGRADIAITLYKVKTKESDDGHIVSGPKNYIPEYPSSKGPVPAEGANPNHFRRLFLEKAGREITRMFIAYPPEEKHENID
jgi:hypothetical protein